MSVVRVCVFPRPKRAAMSAARDPGSSAARRRRERRFPSFLRHELMAVAMAVAEAMHHSSRGQTTATAISEVEEQETNNAPRRQKAPPPGMLPASLAEPVARRGAGTLRPSGADPRRSCATDGGPVGERP